MQDLRVLIFEKSFHHLSFATSPTQPSAGHIRFVFLHLFSPCFAVFRAPSFPFLSASFSRRASLRLTRPPCVQQIPFPSSRSPRLQSLATSRLRRSSVRFPPSSPHRLLTFISQPALFHTHPHIPLHFHWHLGFFQNHPATFYPPISHLPHLPRDFSLSFSFLQQPSPPILTSLQPIPFHSSFIHAVLALVITLTQQDSSSSCLPFRQPTYIPNRKRYEREREREPSPFARKRLTTP